jgi:hypothetical protein
MEGFLRLLRTCPDPRRDGIYEELPLKETLRISRPEVAILVPEIILDDRRYCNNFP